MKSKEEIAIEEAAIKYYEDEQFNSNHIADVKSFEDGAKWALEQFKKEQEHECKYCGVKTYQPDELCYMNPNNQIPKDLQEAIDRINFHVRYNESEGSISDCNNREVVLIGLGYNLTSFGQYLADKINELNPKKQ